MFLGKLRHTVDMIRFTVKKGHFLAIDSILRNIFIVINYIHKICFLIDGYAMMIIYH